MDLSSAIATGGAGAEADLTTNLGAVALIAIPLIIALVIFKKALGALRRV